MKDADITPILQKSLDGQDLTVTEIEALLAAEDQNSVAQLFEAARTVKTQYFGNKVFLYGFVYFSTHCRNNCSFCFYRSSNTDSVRYRKTDDEILELATSLEDSGVHVIDLTMGEDPLIHNDNHYNRLTDLVKMVNDSVDIPLMVSPGAIPERLFPVLMENGADWIACYQETHNMELFKKLRPDQDYDLGSIRRNGLINTDFLQKKE